MRRKRAKVLIMTFCEAIAATSLRRSVCLQSQSQEWWDHDVKEKFHPRFQDLKGYFSYICELLFTRVLQQDTQFKRVTLKSHEFQ